MVVTLPLRLPASRLAALLFGREYAPAADLLRLRARSLPLEGPGAVRAHALSAEAPPRFNLLCAVVDFVCNLALAWWLIPRFGAVGAAWASVLPRLASVVVISFFFDRTRRQGVMMLRAVRAPASLFNQLLARGAK